MMKWLPVLSQLVLSLCVQGNVIRIESSPLKIPISAEFKEGDLIEYLAAERQRVYEFSSRLTGRSKRASGSNVPITNQAVSMI